MKNLFVIVFVLMSVALFAGKDTNTYKNMNVFPIGFWNYAGIERQSAENVKEWKEMGMTVAMSPYYYEDSKPEYKKKMLGILDECHKNGIKVIVRDARTFFDYMEKNGEEAYRKAFKKAYNDFGKHPAVLGFHVGDEPNAKQMPYYFKCMKIQKDIAPELSPYFNLLPFLGSDLSWAGYEMKSVEEFTDYIMENCPAQLFALDCYSQINGEKNTKEGIDKYFKLINTYYKAAAKYKIPFYMTCLSVPHFNYRKPDMDDIRWQLNTSFAHGAKGVLWFYIYEMTKETNYRDAPINMFGDKNQIYRDLSYENRKFHRFYDKTAAEIELIQAYHIYKSYGDTPLFEGNDIVSKVTSDQEQPAILSFFSDNYICVVNNSQDKNSRVKVFFTDKVRSVKGYFDNGEEKEVFAEHCAYFEKENNTALCFWLAPGQMEIFKLKVSD